MFKKCALEADKLVFLHGGSRGNCSDPAAGGYEEAAQCRRELY